MARISWDRFVASREIDPGRFTLQFWLWDERVFWDRFEIPGADARTFEYWNDIWAADARHIYSHASRIRDADYDSFEVLNHIFAKDKNHVYCIHGVCPHCDAKSFEVLDRGTAKYIDSRCGYARDAQQVFYHDSGEGNARILRGANRDTFRILKGGYATDGKRIYVFGRRIPQVNPATFHPLGRFYSTDGIRVFYLNFEVPQADLDSFTVIADDRAQDKQHAFWHQWVKGRAKSKPGHKQKGKKGK